MTDWPADAVERRSVASLIPFAKNSRTHSDDARPLAAVRNVALTLIRPAGLYVPEGRENFREGRASSISLVTGRVL